MVTFQTMDALKELINQGYLECNEKFINLKKSWTNVFMGFRKNE